MIKLLKNMYSKISARIKVGNYLYDHIFDECGTNQGGPLSPSMFRRMLQDLSQYLSQKNGIVMNDTNIIMHMLWADDLILISDSSEGLQKQIDGVFEFCRKSQMIVNSLKTKVMLFGNCRKNCSFTFNGTSLDIVNEYKYLGIIFNSIQRSNGCIFKCMKKYTCDKALKACFACLKKVAHLGKATPKIGLKLFDSFVSPVLDYGCELWSDNSIQDIEKVQLKFLKMILGVKLSTCNMAIYCELGRYPIGIRHKVRLLKYWCRITRMSDDKVVKIVYRYLKNLTDQGFVTWVSKIKSLLSSYGLLEYYEGDSVNVMEEKSIVAAIKSQLVNEFEKTCMEQLHSYPILRTYVTFKTKFGMESYLENIRDFKLRKVMSKFRLSSHGLQIEKGRHLRVKQPVNERTCMYCPSSVEDEFHFLIVCKAYITEREVLYEKIELLQPYTIIQRDNPQITFVNIMESSDPDILFSVCKFLQKCFKLRGI